MNRSSHSAVGTKPTKRVQVELDVAVPSRVVALSERLNEAFGPALVIRFVSENPYFFAIPALVATPQCLA